MPDLRRVTTQSNSVPSKRGWISHRHSVDDEIQSVDTELLVTQPPMPIVDVSPSLTTVSDSETMVESESDADTEVYVPLRVVTAGTRQASVGSSFYDVDKFSPTSVFASTNPHAAVRSELPKRFQLWKL